MNPTAQSQISFAQAEYEKKKKRTRREVFLEKMEQVVPWARLMQVILYQKFTSLLPTDKPKPKRRTTL